MQASDRISQQLSASERLAVALTFLWPYLLIDVVIHESYHADARLEYVGAILEMFVVLPWAVRRALQSRYSTFRFDFVRTTGEARAQMNYAASLSVAWLLVWRSAVIVAFLGALFEVIVERSGGSVDLRSHGTLSADLLVWLVRAPIEGAIYFWLLKAALRKQYMSFSIRVHRTGNVVPRLSPLYES